MAPPILLVCQHQPQAVKVHYQLAIKLDQDIQVLGMWLQVGVRLFQIPLLTIIMGLMTHLLIIYLMR